MSEKLFIGKYNDTIPTDYLNPAKPADGSREGALADAETGIHRPSAGPSVGLVLSVDLSGGVVPLCGGGSSGCAGLGFRRMQGPHQGAVRELGIFLSGAVGNTVIAVFLAWLGQKLGIPLYLAAVVVFGTRMFQNFAEIRRELLTNRQKSDKIKQDIASQPEDGTK